MDQNKVIKINYEVHLFSAITDESFDIKRRKNMEEIYFPFMKKQIIRINDDGLIVDFELANIQNNTFILSLSKANFENKNIPLYILDQICDDFNLGKKVGFNPEYYSLSFKNIEGYGSCNMDFKELDNKNYVLLYATKRTREAQSMAEDYFSDDIIYVNGIWEVELSEEFKNKIYRHG